MNYSAPLKKIIEHTESRTQSVNSQYTHHLLHEMRRIAQSVESLESLVNHKDPKQTDAAHTYRIAEASRKLSSSREKYIERAWSLTQESARATELALHERANLTPTAYAPEIRAAFLKMTHKKRAETLEKAIKDGDSEVLAAVINAPELVTGLDKEMRENYKENLFLTVAPELVKERDQVMETFNACLTVSDTVKKAVENSFDPDKLREIEELTQQHQEAAAKFEASLG